MASRSVSTIGQLDFGARFGAFVSGLEVPFPGNGDRRRQKTRFEWRANLRRILQQMQRDDMYKLIAILVAVIPIILFLKTVFFGRSQVMKQASSDLRRQIDYLVWAILFLVACGILYSVVNLIYPVWK